MKKIHNLCISAIMLALLIICSKITIPLGVISLTLQTFIVILLSLILNTKYTFLVFITYIILGLLGLPVFSGGGGFAYVLKPSFGFIIGFLLQSFLTSRITPESNRYIKYIYSMIGLFIIYLCGVIYMYSILNYYMDLDKNMMYILSVGVTPFIIKDMLSIILACLIYSRIKSFAFSSEPQYFEEKI